MLLFVEIFIAAFVYSLDISLKYAYQPTATDSFSSHSLLATISVLRVVITSAALFETRNEERNKGRPHQARLISDEQG